MASVLGCGRKSVLFSLKKTVSKTPAYEIIGFVSKTTLFGIKFSVMEIVKEFEKKVLEFMTADLFSHADLNKIIRECKFVSCDYTGSGYYLEISHPDLPESRIVCSEPTVMGEAEGMTVGFMIFIENNYLWLECHSWSEKEVPEHFRDYDVSVRCGKIVNGSFIELKSSV
jgi:hypothetical protein